MGEPFFVRALLAGLGLALLAGPLGCLVVWRRMAFLADTMGHSALLGIVLGLALGMGAQVGVLIVFGGVALLVAIAQSSWRLPTDAMLALLAYTLLALGLLFASAMPVVRMELLSYLFGDILTVRWTEVLWIYGACAVGLPLLRWLWPALVRGTVHEELARAEGVSIALTRGALILFSAIFVSLGIKVVGALLITPLLVIPVVIAHGLARSPEGMACWAALAGMLAVLLGMRASFYWDLPPGPAIVVAAALLLLLRIGGTGFARLIARRA